MRAPSALARMALRLPGGRGSRRERELARYREGLREIARVCEAAARGELEPRVLAIDGDDDLGQVANRINHLLDLTDAYVRESSAALHAANEGRYHRRFLTRGMLGSFGAGAATINEASGEMEAKSRALGEAKVARVALADDFERSVLEIVESVAAASTEAAAAAQTLVQAAHHVLEESTAATRASESSARGMSEAAAAGTRVGETVAAIDDEVKRAYQATQDAVAGVRQATGNMAGLTDASRTIGEVVKLIQGIAGQTKLLALNATIEAARAGDVGKGFGVVAGEVRKLASRTADATDQIAQEVHSIQAVTHGAADAIAAMAQTVTQATSSIGASVDSQRAATGAIGESIHHASAEAQRVATSLSGVRAAATDTNAAAEQMLATADELSRMAHRLQESVAGFLEEVRNG